MPGIGQQTYTSMRAATPQRLRSTAARGVEAFGAATRGLRVLPDFLIVGGQRCGTNSLYEYLAKHRAVGRAIPGQEVHYFDLAYHRGLDWYRAHFPTRMGMRITERRSGSRPIAGESSPYYMFHPLAPARIAETLPSAKLIVLLRNPIDRAQSHYHHERSRGRESFGFEEAVDVEPERLLGEVERIRSEPGYASYNHQHFSYLARGRYAGQLEALQSLFPRDQVLVLISEELFSEPSVVHAETLKFLGLKPSSPQRYRRHNAGRYEEMEPSLRGRLRDHFAPSNDRVAQLLGRDLPWD